MGSAGRKYLDAGWKTEHNGEDWKQREQLGSYYNISGNGWEKLGLECYKRRRVVRSQGILTVEIRGLLKDLNEDFEKKQSKENDTILLSLNFTPLRGFLWFPKSLLFGQQSDCHTTLCAYLIPAIHPEGFPGHSDRKASVCNAGDLGSIPGLGRSPGGGNGSPLQYSYLENPMDGEAW